MTAYQDALDTPYLDSGGREATLLIMRHVTEELERLVAAQPKEVAHGK